MAWNEQWTHQIDGVDLNDPPNGIVCDVPEVHNLDEREVILVPVDGGYPVYHRSQPQSARRTFFIHLVRGAGGAANWYTRLEALQALMTPGEHEYTYQVRGMDEPATVTIVFESLGDINFRLGRMTAVGIVPDPRPA